MNKAQLLKKLEGILEEFERSRSWGAIEIEMQSGGPRLVRKIVTERMEENVRDTTHANRYGGR